DLPRMERHRLSPSVGGDLAPISVESDHDSPARHAAAESPQKPEVQPALRKRRAADDDLGGPAADQLPGARNAAYAAANANLHLVFAAGAFAERFHQRVVVSPAHRGIEVDDVQPPITPEPVELRE